jgi:hypothetical protein
MTDHDLYGRPEAAAESTVDELVDLLNARDFDALEDLLDPEVSAAFFGLTGRAGIIEGLNDLTLRNPGLVTTRGELGEEPVLVAWVPGPNHGYERMGVFTFAFSDDGGERLIEHITYDDQPGDLVELLAERPDPEDMPQGIDWDEWDGPNSD